jgi:tripartite ATP-independent transporter DctP family solute receptor
MKKIVSISIMTLTFVFALFFSNASAAKIELKLGHILSANGPQNIGCEKFAELMKEKTNGMVEVKVYPASQLGSGPNMLNGLKIGSVDIYVGAIAWGEMWDKNYGVFGLLNTWRSQDHYLKFLKSDLGQNLIEDLRKSQGIRIINSFWYRPPRQIFSTKPVRKAKALAGLKIRVPENKVWLRSWKATGANPTPIAWGEVFTSLQQGVIDAMEGPITLVYPMKFHEIAKYATFTNHTRMYVVFFVNDAKFRKLPTEVQRAFQQAADEAGAFVEKLEHKAEIENQEAMKAQGVEIIKAPTNFFKKVSEIPYELEKEGVIRKGLFDAIQEIGK